jgi:hypothetical protein
MAAAESKSASRTLMLLSLALIAANFPFAKFDGLQISGIPITVPFQFLWLAWAYIFIPFAREIKEANLQLSYTINKDFKSGLASWSRKIKEKEAPNLYTPQILVSNKWPSLKWELKYCQAGANLEPSFTAVSGRFNSVRIFFFACLKNLLSLKVLEHFSVPILLAALAVFAKLYFLCVNP